MDKYEELIELLKDLKIHHKLETGLLYIPIGKEERTKEIHFRDKQKEYTIIFIFSEEGEFKHIRVRNEKAYWEGFR